MKKIVQIIMQGGVIQDILGINKDMEIQVVDYDEEGYDEEDLTHIEEDDGTIEDAYISIWDSKYDSEKALNDLNKGVLKAVEEMKAAGIA